MVSYTKMLAIIKAANQVLILVVMEDGLVPLCAILLVVAYVCLNPCCNGRWSRTFHQ